MLSRHNEELFKRLMSRFYPTVASPDDPPILGNGLDSAAHLIRPLLVDFEKHHPNRELEVRLSNNGKGAVTEEVFASIYNRLSEVATVIECPTVEDTFFDDPLRMPLTNLRVSRVDGESQFIVTRKRKIQNVDFKTSGGGIAVRVSLSEETPLEGQDRETMMLSIVNARSLPKRRRTKFRSSFMLGPLRVDMTRVVGNGTGGEGEETTWEVELEYVNPLEMAVHFMRSVFYKCVHELVHPGGCGVASSSVERCPRVTDTYTCDPSRQPNIALVKQSQPCWPATTTGLPFDIDKYHYAATHLFTETLWVVGYCHPPGSTTDILTPTTTTTRRTRS